MFNCLIYLLVFTGFVVVAQRGLTSPNPPKARKVLLQYGTLLGLACAMLLTADQEKECFIILFGTGLLFVLDLIKASENKEQRTEPLVMRLEGIACLTHRPNHYKPSRLEAFLFNIAGLSLFMLIVSYSIGSGLATQSTGFLVSVKDPSLIFIKVKDGRAICSRYDPITKKVLGRVVIVPLSESENTEFVLTKLG